MLQPLVQEHFLDSAGNPDGGYAAGIGLNIRFQRGPLCVDGVRREPNGAFVEGVIAAAIGRLEFYQGSKFKCAENERALEHLRAALAELQGRTKAREAQGVEGTHQVHAAREGA